MDPTAQEIMQLKKQVQLLQVELAKARGEDVNTTIESLKNADMSGLPSLSAPSRTNVHSIK